MSNTHDKNAMLATIMIARLIVALVGFTGGYYLAVWLGVPGNWPWLVAVVSMVACVRSAQPIIMKLIAEVLTKS